MSPTSDMQDLHMLPISPTHTGASRELASANATPASFGTGAAAIAMAIVFNLPFATLASIYEYPQILRRPAGEALDAFAAGGPLLVLTWYGFALTALALVPLAIGLSISAGRLTRHPVLSIGAAIVGTLAGLTQAIGLMRWVFVVPALAAAHADPAASPAVTASTEAAFALLNNYGGVAVGEHLGQLLTAMFVGLMALLQWREAARIASSIGVLTVLLIVAGTGEGLALALGQSGDMFSLATIAGFLGLTAWFIATGAGLIRNAMRR
jgi:hypothetical protein